MRIYNVFSAPPCLIHQLTSDPPIEVAFAHTSLPPTSPPSTLTPFLLMAPKCEPLCRFDDRSVWIDIRTLLELIHPTCRLYFTTFPHPPPKQETLNDPRSQSEQVNVRGIRTPPCESSEPTKNYYFTIDDQLMYMSFFQDWGPLNVAMVYKACIYIHSLLIVSVSLFCGRQHPYPVKRSMEGRESGRLPYTRPIQNPP